MEGYPVRAGRPTRGAGRRCPNPRYRGLVTGSHRRVRTAALVVLLVIAGCGEQGEIDRLAPRPAPDDPPSGTFMTEISVAGTDFRLYDEGAGCLAVDIVQPGLQRTVEHGCFAGEHVLGATTACGWLTAAADAYPLGCDVRLPRVIFGRVDDPQIGFACLGVILDGGKGVIESARFVTIGDNGVIFEPALPDETAVAHLFTARGARYGQPPMDAPSDPIYRYCESLAPWGEPEATYLIELSIDLGVELRRGDVVLALDAGLGAMRIAGDASPSPILFPMDVPASASGLTVSIEREAGSITTTLLWPAELAAMLTGGRRCDGPTRLSVQVALDSTGTGIQGGLTLTAIACTATG